MTRVTSPDDPLEVAMSTPKPPVPPAEPAPTPPPAEPTRTPPAAAAHRLPVGTMLAVAILLLIPCAALAAVPVYSRETPKLWDWPFFYWYQMLWVLITPVLTYLAYVLISRARGER